ncbi:MAG TPA: diadenylate cyclase [Acidimicrobiales bacterium]|nr:diadenylate cyclase [Acidimicrobiales bacterium]
MTTPARLRRLVEELGESGLDLGGPSPWREAVLDELDYALRPPVHERRVASVGAVVEPTTEPPAWELETALTITLRPLGEMPLVSARMFADGLSSWLIRPVSGPCQWAIFDRPAGSERDLVVLADAMGATLVQRHPVGAVRIVGSFGVLRWDGLSWHHEPPISSWLDTFSPATCPAPGDARVLEQLLEFAVHDLGARGIGATLVYRPNGEDGATDARSRYQVRLPAPPPLQITRPSDLAPLRHVLAQVDGAAVLDGQGTLRQLGVRLVPSADAEAGVEPFGGMRHTSGRRYSFDDPTATVIVVSDDGPVTVLRNGHVLGSSARAFR